MVNQTASLHIDTSKQKETHISIETINGEKCCLDMQGYSQTVLPAIERLSRQMGVSIDQIRSITVVTGDGSFTGLRLGVSVSKTIGLLFNVPVNGQKAWEITNIKYVNDKFVK
jgi:tRNA threonylcarbamoyladenosine biosynthesis protein TsaB